MKYEDARDTCHMRSAIYRKSVKTRYWKNNKYSLDYRILPDQKLADDWEEYDPRDYDEGSLFMFND